MNLKSYFSPLFFFLLYITLSTQLFAQESLRDIDYQKGILSYYAKNFEAALQYFKDSINEDPDFWQGYQMEGYTDFYLGQTFQMKTAFTESLKLHPDNPSLTEFIQKIDSPPTTAIPLAGNSNPTIAPPTLGNPNPTIPPLGPITTALPTASPTPISEIVKTPSPFWLKVGVLGDYANLDVLDTSAGLWQANLIHDSINGVGSLSHLGFGGVVEAALELGQDAAFSFRMSYRGGNGFTETVNNAAVSESQLIDPELLTLGLDYYQYFPESFGRFFLCLGGLLGQALVPVNVQTPQYTITGTMGGSALGAEVGLGNEFYLQPDTALEISLRFQTLIVNQVEINYTDNAGNSGELALAQNGGQVFLADTRALTGSEGYAPLDFSGILIGASLTRRLF